jgi:flagellar protein FlaD
MPENEYENLENKGENAKKLPEKLPENANIIKLEEIQGDKSESYKDEKKEAETRTKEYKEYMERRYPEEDKVLDESELRSYIFAERGRIPSVVLNELFENLKGRRVTLRQLRKILSRIKENLDEGANFQKIDDLYKKLDALENLLKTFSTSIHHSKQVVEAEDEDKLIEEQDFEEVKDDNDFDELEGFEDTQTISHDGLVEEEKYGGGMEMEKIIEKRDWGRQHRLPRASRKTNGNGMKLESLPTDPKRIMFLLKWIEYLIERVGYQDLENALDYYVDIGWISEDVLFSIMRYAKGIRLYHEKSDWRPIGYLNVQDHLMSLLFIEALKTGKFSKEKMLEVEREIYKMKREVMELNGI